MKFGIAKKDGIECAGCQSHIMRGDDMVVNTYTIRGYKKVLTYHTGCYLPWYTTMFHRKWNEWKHGTGNTERPKLGRPPTIDKPTKEQTLNRLRSNLSYHKSKNHPIKVKIIENKIAAILL